MVDPTYIQHNVRHNMVVNIADGAFFGFGAGFASSVTVVPLFVDSLTDSTALIGLVASFTMIGWQIPQIFTARYVARLPIYRPMVLRMTMQERWPFLALALLALMLPVIGPTAALLLAFFLLCWQALGGGFTATPWQTMIGKIIPLRRRGVFWGMQSAVANLFIALGGALAGLLLATLKYPHNFAACFFLAFLAMMISQVFLSWTREPARIPEPETAQDRQLWARLGHIVRTDGNLRMFMLARMCSQFGWMAVAFYTVYGVRRFGMDAQTAGIMLAVLTLTKASLNPILGWIGDQIGHRRVFAAGMIALCGSAFVAMAAPSLNWMYLAFALAGVGHCTLWTIAITMTVEFGTEAERPYYIGLANTLVAPATLLAPIIGGLMADVFGYEATFALAAVSSLAAAAVLLFRVRDPRFIQVMPAMAPIAHAPAGD